MSQPLYRPYYRPDIQGLRAIAVLGVIFFHAGLPLPGGFTGVDVFFVISGFVIGGLLLRELQETGTFAPRPFYLRRARRLLPAVGIMVLICLLLSMVLISPVGLSQESVGRAAIASTLFSSNFYFWVFSGGYFQNTATSNPFLHTWSLSVEEQFYFVIPWILLLGWRCCKANRIKGVVLAASLTWVASFIFNLIFSYSAIPAWVPIVGPVVSEHPAVSTSFSFYSPLTRAWEFLTGFLVFIVSSFWKPSMRFATILSVLGFIAVSVGFLLIRKEQLFPGLVVLSPVIGTALLLVAGSSSQTNFVTTLCLSRPMTYIGDISYSWYLWHWPAVVFTGLWFSSPFVIVLAALLAIVPAIFSYHLIEQPIHKKRSLRSNRKLLYAVGVCMGAPIFVSLFLIAAWKQHWWLEDLKELHVATTQPHLTAIYDCADVIKLGSSGDSCMFPYPEARGTVLLIGDSTAGMFSEAVLEAAKENGLSLEVAARNGCPFAQLPEDFGDRACREFVNSVFKEVIERPKPYDVVIVSNSGRYPFKMMDTFSSDMNSSGRVLVEKSIEGYASAIANALNRISVTSPVILLEPIPFTEGDTFPRCAAPSLLFEREQSCGFMSKEYVDKYRTRTVLEVRKKLRGNIRWFDPSIKLCSSAGDCSVYKDNRVIYRDGSHLSSAGGMLYVEDFSKLLGQEKPSALVGE